MISSYVDVEATLVQTFLLAYTITICNFTAYR